ncbi:hypothetical protein OK006_9148 [Actinobacteria bacterium OK006]|nr:hypothetical protein OK006_9148 [Actinobacteria bacterium OK006]
MAATDDGENAGQESWPRLSTEHHVGATLPRLGHHGKQGITHRDQCRSRRDRHGLGHGAAEPSRCPAERSGAAADGHRHFLTRQTSCTIDRRGLCSRRRLRRTWHWVRHPPSLHGGSVRLAEGCRRSRRDIRRVRVAGQSWPDGCCDGLPHGPDQEGSGTAGNCGHRVPSLRGRRRPRDLLPRLGGPRRGRSHAEERDVSPKADREGRDPAPSPSSEYPDGAVAPTLAAYQIPMMTGTPTERVALEYRTSALSRQQNAFA